MHRIAAFFSLILILTQNIIIVSAIGGSYSGVAQNKMSLKRKIDGIRSNRLGHLERRRRSIGKPFSVVSSNEPSNNNWHHNRKKITAASIGALSLAAAATVHSQVLHHNRVGNTFENPTETRDKKHSCDRDAPCRKEYFRMIQVPTHWPQTSPKTPSPSKTAKSYTAPKSSSSSQDHNFGSSVSIPPHPPTSSSSTSPGAAMGLAPLFQFFEKGLERFKKANNKTSEKKQPEVDIGSDNDV